MPTAADWQVLTRLFADEPTGFRHQMGLVRSSVLAFYAPSAEAVAIRAEKEAVLASPAAEQYFIETAEGSAAFHEFVDTIGVAGAATRRAVTLALEPDWMLMAPGSWTLVWASVCFPTRWSLAGKACLPLTDIHGIVPGLNQELGRKIGVFFDRLVPGEGWGRANWGLSSNPNRNQHPDLPYTPLSSQTAFAEVSVRLESQHLLKIPATGAISFGIRILNFPLAEIAADAGIAAGLKERLRTMPGEVAAYKGIPADFWQQL